jgi:hypothetical protein
MWFLGGHESPGPRSLLWSNLIFGTLRSLPLERLVSDGLDELERMATAGDRVIDVEEDLLLDWLRSL